ncbi:hypothetical protein [Mycoplasmopsis gallinacea]|uniref:Uncharacterized protein n=1 Tax=Mycoplasmopsis gallinacea TaxID=29556 RepID=A0A6H0V0V9_9BACT|nr:hypothetical protein [Mycoplasmopsis gallinacea]QIW61980.1 hypothetical protein GOQ20_00635 [Mycoplasmopsis gallinacea]
MEQLKKEISFLKLKFSTLNSSIKLIILALICVLSLNIFFWFFIYSIAIGSSGKVSKSFQISVLIISGILSLILISFILSRIFFIIANVKNKENKNIDFEKVANLYKIALLWSWNIYRYKKIKNIILNAKTN